MSGPVAGVIGWPVAHSRSPLIHGHWLRTLGIAGEYRLLPVAPEAIDGFLAGLPGSGLAGANVTVPHKERAFAALARAEPAAAALGAANTLWLEGDRLAGTNTDAAGFLANLDQEAPGWDGGGKAVVLGAGGAARAVVWALRRRGFAPVHVVNRSYGRAEELARRFGPGVAAAGWEALPALLADARLLVNATSLGMKGQPPLALDLTPLPADALVTDIVYVPLETGLLAAARARGNPVVDGLGMLLHQAVPGFERWFGTRPAVTPALRAEIVATLSPAGS